jgi:chromosome segregation ATPase
VIVDLPAVHDSNAARAAVAQGYMKQCTGLWIVAPINRAVDDKAAKTLLGESFKQQLKYDGGFSSVTFICSKTDDISITEATDTLDLGDEVEELYDQQRRCEREINDVKDKTEELKETQEAYRQAQKGAADDIEVWEALEERLDDGKQAFEPAPKSNKRKNTKPHAVRKKRQKDGNDSDDDFIVSDDEDAATESEDDSDDEDVQAPCRELNIQDVKAKLKELHESRKMARREVSEYKTKIEELRSRTRELKEKIAEIKAEISHKCIAGRNDYLRRAIQQDFAAGIKELDQENAAEEDEDNFNPDEELRDYDKVAESLPVFCVSSRAYQKMSGHLAKDDGVPGF